MADWDGRGLPPAAVARMQRFRADGVRTSLLDVPGAVGVETVGLSPVGEVMGSMVQQIGWQGFGGCGYGYGGLFGTMAGPPAGVVGRGAGFVGYQPYVDALYRGYGTALGRMVLEATEMGAVGVVGVTVRERHFGQNVREFVAMGTAVTGAGDRPRQPFVTDLAGSDVAKLMLAGWVPVTLAYGISVAIRHDDYTTRMQTLRFTSNTEVGGYTELVTFVRHEARELFAQHVQQAGADGAIVSDMSLGLWPVEPSDNHVDHLAQAIVTGTSLARFHHGARPAARALSVIPLRPLRPEDDA